MITELAIGGLGALHVQAMLSALVADDSADWLRALSALLAGELTSEVLQSSFENDPRRSLVEAARQALTSDLEQAENAVARASRETAEFGVTFRAWALLVRVLLSAARGEDASEVIAQLLAIRQLISTAPELSELARLVELVTTEVQLFSFRTDNPVRMTRIVQLSRNFRSPLLAPYQQRLRAIWLARQGHRWASVHQARACFSSLERQGRHVEACISRMLLAMAVADLELDLAREWLECAEQSAAAMRASGLAELARKGRASIGENVQQDDDHQNGSGNPGIALHELAALSGTLAEAETVGALAERFTGLLLRMPKTRAAAWISEGRVVASTDAGITAEALADAANLFQSDPIEHSAAAISTRNGAETTLWSVRHHERIFGCVWVAHTEPLGNDEHQLLRALARVCGSLCWNLESLYETSSTHRDLNERVRECTSALDAANERLEVTLKQLEETTLRVEENKRRALDAEFLLASAVQQKLLPPAAPVQRGCFAISGAVYPAAHCGGDLWSYHEDVDRLLIFVGDATGHGMGSAMLTATLKGALEMLWSSPHSMTPAEMLRHLHEVVRKAAGGTLFVTAFMAEISKKQQLVTYSFAGHPPQLAVVDGSITSLQLAGTPLGCGGVPDVAEQSFRYDRSLRLALVTDGVIERANAQGTLYGFRRFRACLRSSSELLPSAARDAIAEDLRSHGAGTPADDDITVVLLDVSAGNASSERLVANG